MYIERKKLLRLPDAQAIAYLRKPQREHFARFLADILIDQVGKDTPKLVKPLRQLTENLFQPQQNMADLTQTIFEKFKPNQATYQKLLGAWVRVGHFVEVAGHLERENFFDIGRRNREIALQGFDPKTSTMRPTLRETDMVPYGLEELSFPTIKTGDEDKPGQDRTHLFKSATEFIDQVRQITFEPIITAHTTNVDTLEAQQLLRDLHDAGCEMLQRPEQFRACAQRKIPGLIKRFSAIDLTPHEIQDGKKVIRNFTPQEEQSLALGTLERIFYGKRPVEKAYEDFLERSWPDYNEENRARFHLRLLPYNWVMNDKDGHAGLKAEHSLQMDVRERAQALRLYQKELQALAKQGLVLRNAQGKNWAHILGHAAKRIEDLNAELVKHTTEDGRDIPLKQSQFDRIVAELTRPFTTSDADKDVTFPRMAQQLADTVETAYQNGDAAQKDRLIFVKRQLRDFPLFVARSEYRETAAEYTKVIAYLLTDDPFTNKKLDYEKLSAEHRAKLLDRILLERPDLLAVRAQQFLAGIEETEDYRRYDDQRPDIITYHTLKRMQLAFAEPDKFKDMVSAECASHADIMEAVALQRAVSPLREGKAAHDLHVTPLLEDLDKLNGAPKMVVALLQMKSYRQHLLRLAGGDPAKIRIKVQLAHSDNIRVGGTPAARGALYDTLKAIEKLLLENDGPIRKLFAADGVDAARLQIALERSDGQSHSDLLRNGKRAFTAQINAAQSWVHCKTTFQGIDQQNYFGYSTSIKRLLARHFSHCSKELSYRKQVPEAQIERYPHLHAAVSTALARTFDDYFVNHFNVGNPMGHLFAHPLVAYNLYSKIFNRGTRPAKRGDSEARRSDSYLDHNYWMFPVDIAKIRSISYSNVANDANIVPTWLAMANLRTYLNESFAPHTLASADLEDAARNEKYPYNLRDAKGELTSEALRLLYHVPPPLRDVVDKAAIGVIHSDVTKRRSRFAAAEKAGITTSPDIKAYDQKLKQEYEQAALLVLATIDGGEPVPSRHPNLELRHRDYKAYLLELRDMVAEKLPRAREELELKRRIASSLSAMRDDIILRARHTPESDSMLSDIASGQIAARHGRAFTIDDPRHGKHLYLYKNKKYPIRSPGDRAS